MMYITTAPARHTQQTHGIDPLAPPQPRQAPDTPPPPPGANPQTMGGESAKAMSIGTGGSQQDKYSSSYSTPNYTQYTNNNYRGEI